MQFVYPQFLFALFALAIPVIIHLFNFRRYKRIYFPNIHFLQTIEQESKSRNRLRHLLLLLMRLLAIAAIVFAFAQPFIPKEETLIRPGQKLVGIYVDNSYSMGAIGKEGDLLAMAKAGAEDIAASFSDGDQFILVTNDFEIEHGHPLSREQFITEVQDVDLSPHFRTMQEITERMQEGLSTADSGARIAYYLSDFQEKMADETSLPETMPFPVTLLPLTAQERNNLYIDSVWFEAPLLQMGQATELQVRVVSGSEQEVEEATLTLSINGRQKALASYNLGAGQSAVVRVPFTVTEPGINKAMVEITDYPVTFDDRLYFSFEVQTKIPILSINNNDEMGAVQRALTREENFSLTNTRAGSVDYSQLQSYNFVVLNEIPELSQGLAAALQDYVQKGGNLLLIPAAGNSGQTYAPLLDGAGAGSLGGVVNNELRLSPPDLSQSFFQNMFERIEQNVDMPLIKRYYDRNSGPSEVLLRLRNGSPFFTSRLHGRGYLYVLSAPLHKDWSNLTEHYLFLPMLYKMALQRSYSPQLYHYIGGHNYLQVPNPADDKEQVYVLYKDNMGQDTGDAVADMIPPQRIIDGRLSLYVEGLIPEAGHYGLHLRKEEARPSQDPHFSFNFDRRESAMRFADAAAIAGAHGGIEVIEDAEMPMGTAIASMEQSGQLWKLFVILALLFLIAETLILRFWK